MISITKEEKQRIHERFPRVHIVRTMKNDSKRHHYYMTEDLAPMRMLYEMRGIPFDKKPNFKKRGRGGNRA